MKKIFLSVFLIVFINPNHVFSQYDKIIMHSNKRDIILFNGEGRNQWTIEPKIRPDIYRIYSETETKRRIRFISDIDSLDFNVEINQPIYFSIIYNQDTAYTAIEFINYIPNTMSDSEKLYALSLLWSETKYNFAYIDKLKFDLDSLYKSYIPKVLTTKNDFDFYDEMKLFVGHLKDGHTNINFREFSNYTDYIPADARYFDDDLIIVSVHEQLAELIPIGSIIIEVNGIPLQDYMKKEVEPYIESDFEPTVKYLSASKLFSSNLTSNTIDIKYKTPESKILVTTLLRDGSIRSRNYIGHQNKRWNKPIEITWSNNEIAILTFNTFVDYNNRLIHLFDDLKDTLYSSNGIVIDLRNNRGGGTDVAWHLLKHIIKEPYFLNFAWQTRINDGVKRANGNWIKANEDFYKNTAYQTFPADTVFIPESIKRFDVPIVVLFSTMTVSAAEDFLIILYERPDRPLFVGQPSFGSTGSPLMVWGLPDNGFARICARRVLFPYSMKPFTEGIYPDIIVNYNFDDFMSGEDKDLEVAIKELEKLINSKKK